MYFWEILQFNCYQYRLLRVADLSCGASRIFNTLGCQHTILLELPKHMVWKHYDDSLESPLTACLFWQLIWEVEGDCVAVEDEHRKYYYFW